MRNCFDIYARESMQTTVTIDDKLYPKASDMAYPEMDEANRLVYVQAAKRLATLGRASADMLGGLADVPTSANERVLIDADSK